MQRVGTSNSGNAQDIYYLQYLQVKSALDICGRHLQVSNFVSAYALRFSYAKCILSWVDETGAVCADQKTTFYKVDYGYGK